MDGNENRREDVNSLAIRAGRRTYFFDVKETRKGDYYLTITESKKVFNRDGEGFKFEKHKVFLYKEDFMKFSKAFEDSINFIKEAKPDYFDGDESLVEFIPQERTEDSEDNEENNQE